MEFNNKKMPSNLNDVARGARKKDEEFINRQLKIISETLFEKDLEPIEKLPEEVFEEYFLDYFKNYKKEEENDPTLLKKWLELSGGYYNEVALVNREGEEVIVVPPLIPTTKLNKENAENSKIGLISSVYKQESKHLPELALSNFKNQLDVNGQNLINNDSSSLDAKTRWVAIFNYFDKKRENREKKENTILNEFIEKIEKTGKTKSIYSDLDYNYE